MQDGGTQQWKLGDIRCGIRCKTKRHLDYHIAKCHTTEGIGKKLQSEQRLAEFLTSKDIAFDRDWANRISYKTQCPKLEVEGAAVSSRPDFFLPELSIKLTSVVLLGNDEYAHRSRACDFQRVFNIANALDANPDFRGLPIVYVRFNPHHFTQDGDYYNVPLVKGHATLLSVLTSLDRDKFNPGVNLVYVHYDTVTGADGTVQVALFNENDSDDYVQLYKDCVLLVQGVDA